VGGEPFIEFVFVGPQYAVGMLEHCACTGIFVRQNKERQKKEANNHFFISIHPHQGLDPDYVVKKQYYPDEKTVHH
jgi:hypothetical protein